MNILDRFLKYVSFTTTSDESSESCPSTSQQLELAKYLANELEDIGLSQVKLDENGYVYGLLPATGIYHLISATASSSDMLKATAGARRSGTLLFHGPSSRKK